MVIEFQVDATRFLQAFRNTLMRHAPCSPQAFALNLGPCGNQPVFLDRISVSGSSTLVRTEVNAIHVVQPVSLFLTPVAALEASDAQPGAPCWNPTLELEFALAIQIEGGTPNLCVSFLRVRSSPAVSSSQALIISGFVAQWFPELCTPFDLSPLAGALGALPTAAAADVSADAALTRLTIRLELGPVASNSASQWAAFLAGSIKPNPNAGAWSIFIDGGLLVQSAVARITAGLAGPIDDDTFDLESGPSGIFLNHIPTINALFSGPGVSLAFSGEAVDACVCLWDEIDLDVDITALIAFSVPAPNSLTMSLSIDWDLSDFELVCCAFTAGIFWGFIGTNLLQEEKINWGEFLGGLVGLPVVFSAAITQSHDQVGKFIDLGDDWEQIGKSKKHYRRTTHVNFPNAGLGTMTLTHVVGIEGGLALSGALGPIDVLENAELSAMTDEWSWKVDDPCASNPILQAGFNINFNPVGGFTSTKAPLVVCRAEILPASDPLGQFQPHLEVSNFSLRLSIPLAQLLTEYIAAPYPVQLILVTNGGVRIFTIPPIPILTQAQIQTTMQQVELMAPAICKDWTLVEAFWKGMHFHPAWMIDPPPDREITGLWQIVVSGLNAGQRVQLLSPAGTVLATAGPGPMGEGGARLSALVSPAAGAIGIQTEGPEGQSLPLARRQPLRLHAEGDGEVPDRHQLVRRANRQIIIRQTQLFAAARIRVEKHFGTAAVGTLGGRAMLAIVSATRLLVWDIGHCDAPRIVRIEHVGGLRGVLFDRHGLVAWGRSGLLRLAQIHARLEPFGDQAPVEGLAHAGGRLVAVAEDALSLRSGGKAILESLQPIQALAADRAEIATIELDTLVLRRSDRLIEPASVTLPEPVSVTAAFGRSGAFAVTTQRAGTYVIQRGKDGTATISEHYPLRPPWFAASLRSGRTLVRFDRSAGEITLYRKGASVTIVR
ncbi:hypothetical protein [Thauera sp.]|uniref:hypothetical protein n=1 Tax=Thauera sp. TaxID=1905334 RepID=UPI002BF4C026|nr:hypothetical protein [Thauera sp.]HRP23508.1 hypothetical protein [Thauera sp.]